MTQTDNDNHGLGWGVLAWPKYFARPHEIVAGICYVLLALVIMTICIISTSILFSLLSAVIAGGLGPIENADAFNKLLLSLGGMIGAVTGVPFLIWRTLIAQKQNAIAQENIHSTTMAKAIESLGAVKEEKITHGRAIPDGNPPPETVTNTLPNIEVRLGAIYLLEKLAREHERLHWPIMEILCAYIRENSGPPHPPPPNNVLSAYAAGRRKSHEQKEIIEKRTNSLRPPRVDIQAA